MKLKWDDFKGQFHESWWKWVRPIIESEQFAKDFSKIRESGKQSRIIPSSKSGNLFRIFREVPYDSMTMVVVGLSPYNVVIGNKEIADGIAMSCSITEKEQPTLAQLYNALEKEFGQIERDPSLEYMCKQGIFLYNFSLTTIAGDASAHVDYWRYFTKELFTNAISKSEVPVVTLGKIAEEVTEWLVPWQKVWTLKHPASASYSKIDWVTDGAFTEVIKYLISKGVHISIVKQKESF